MFSHAHVCPQRRGGIPWSLVSGPFQGCTSVLSLVLPPKSCPMSCPGEGVDPSRFSAGRGGGRLNRGIITNGHLFSGGFPTSGGGSRDRTLTPVDLWPSSTRQEGLWIQACWILTPLPPHPPRLLGVDLPRGGGSSHPQTGVPNYYSILGFQKIKEFCCCTPSGVNAPSMIKLNHHWWKFCGQN